MRVMLFRLHSCAIYSMAVIKNKILVTGGDDCIKVDIVFPSEKLQP
jgi:hypothetical protein